MNLDQELRSAIQQAITTLFGHPVDQLQLQPTNQEFEGSHTLVCFPLTRISKLKPEETANAIGNYLVEHSSMISRFNVVKGFLNLVVADSVWASVFTSVYANKQYGQLALNGKEIMVEYSSPNTNKPLHLGHLRNNFLGYSVAELYKAVGYSVHKVQIINDRGIHICKSMAAWKLFGNGETPESSGIKGDHLVGKYYVIFERESVKQFTDILDQAEFDIKESANEFIREFVSQFEIALKNKQDVPLLRAIALNLKAEIIRKGQGLSDDERETLENIASRLYSLSYSNNLLIVHAQELLRKWEEKDAETVALWKRMNGWVYTGFEATYKRMGVDFDKLYYESDTYLLGKEEVLKGLDAGIFFQKEDGSIWVDLTPEGLDQKVLLRSDGTSVYMTQDIGTAILRFRDFPKIEGQVYTVGNEQEYHFKVLFLILGKLGYEWAKKCYHLSYGMVDLPTGKMKSREGTVVDADDLMAEMIEEAEKQTRELGKIEGLSDDEANELFEMIGLGALKFFLLKVDPKKRMLFDPNESIQLQGFTGPFIQYTHARIKAILRKAASMNISTQSDDLNKVASLETTEREILFLLTTYEQKVQEAANLYSPAVIANYTYELAKTYNQFYQTIPIFNEADQSKLKFRIAMSEVVAHVIKHAMSLLGIHVPERM